MNFKEEIKKVLDELKILGYDRRRLEKELNYSEKGIDQAISRGGNEILLKALKAFLEKVRHGGITTKEDAVRAATVRLLFNEVAKLKSKIYGQDAHSVFEEMEQNISLLVEDILRKKS